MQQSDGVLNMLSVVKEAFEAYTPENKSAASTINRVLGLWSGLVSDSNQCEAMELPVCGYLPEVIDQGKAGLANAVATAFEKTVPNLVWAQSGRHTLETRGAEFMDKYAYSSLGITGGEILDVGVLLLGPGITYPVTSYPSEGVFLVVGGSPEWKSGDDPWRRVSAGDVIHRPFNGAEGKRPGSDPMLAFYAWLCN